MKKKARESFFDEIDFLIIVSQKLSLLPLFFTIFALFKFHVY